MKIALIAHDLKKNDLVEWSVYNKDYLAKHELSATGTTGARIEEATKLKVFKYKSGPLGGDLEIGAKIVTGEIDLLIFFFDPMTAQPHDPDVKALLRIAMVYNTPVACNRATADCLITSPLLQ